MKLTVDVYVFIGCMIMFAWWCGYLVAYKPVPKPCTVIQQQPMYVSKGDVRYWANYWGKK